MSMVEFLKEFKKFALRGNMVDLAIGVIIGGAFGKVVNSFVSDLIMPPLGLLLGGIDFSKFTLPLHIPGTTTPPVELKYGAFINSLIDLIIVAGAIFVIIKAMNRVYKQSISLSNNKECPECAMSIPLKAKKCGHCGSQLPK